MYVGDDKGSFPYDDPFYAPYGYPKTEPSPPVTPPLQEQQLGWNQWVTEFNNQTPARQAQLQNEGRAPEMGFMQHQFADSLAGIQAQEKEGEELLLLLLLCVD